MFVSPSASPINLINLVQEKVSQKAMIYMINFTILKNLTFFFSLYVQVITEPFFSFTLTMIFETALLKVGDYDQEFFEAAVYFTLEKKLK